jgi:hypothetical protein
MGIQRQNNNFTINRLSDQAAQQVQPNNPNLQINRNMISLLILFHLFMDDTLVERIIKG